MALDSNQKALISNVVVDPLLESTGFEQLPFKDKTVKVNGEDKLIIGQESILKYAINENLSAIEEYLNNEDSFSDNLKVSEAVLFGNDIEIYDEKGLRKYFNNNPVRFQVNIQRRNQNNNNNLNNNQNSTPKFQLSDNYIRRNLAITTSEKQKRQDNLKKLQKFLDENCKFGNFDSNFNLWKGGFDLLDKIYNHPCPQNRYIESDSDWDEEYINGRLVKFIYSRPLGGWNTGAVKEQEGILGLTKLYGRAENLARIRRCHPGVQDIGQNGGWVSSFRDNSLISDPGGITKQETLDEIKSQLKTKLLELKKAYFEKEILKETNPLIRAEMRLSQIGDLESIPSNISILENKVIEFQAIQHQEEKKQCIDKTKKLIKDMKKHIADAESRFSNGGFNNLLAVQDNLSKIDGEMFRVRANIIPNLDKNIVPAYNLLLKNKYDAMFTGIIKAAERFSNLNLNISNKNTINIDNYMKIINREFNALRSIPKEQQPTYKLLLTQKKKELGNIPVKAKKNNDKKKLSNLGLT